MPQMDKLMYALFNPQMHKFCFFYAVKYLFEFLADKASEFQISDQNILHSWKSNCLQLRFWNQLILNLDHVLDVPLARNNYLERSLHSFSQAVAYACAPHPDPIHADSPFNKTLFASEIRRYWSRVVNFYEVVTTPPRVSRTELLNHLEMHQERYQGQFNRNWAIEKLYWNYIRPFHDKIKKVTCNE
ncbi:unnamed protein product [Protopolystoma xenopodis]|uniref:Plexin cytoplasmic RasGAP domain-containing protein n=1 Tax=Protopolystoma xenopodis TaxID=117903 RepID=A0A448WP89_9PLAT|nr:unnamed protein product [Protopolystoma xenopodis]